MAEDWLDEIDWNRQGVVPALAQDAATGALLQQAWANRQALVLSIARGRAIFCAADGSEPEAKAAGTLRIVEIRSDEARGALLFTVRPEAMPESPAGFAWRLLEGRWQTAAAIGMEPV